MIMSISEVMFIENTCTVCERTLRVEFHRDSKMPGKVASPDRRSDILYGYLGERLP